MGTDMQHCHYSCLALGVEVGSPVLCWVACAPNDACANVVCTIDKKDSTLMALQSTIPTKWSPMIEQCQTGNHSVIS